MKNNDSPFDHWLQDFRVKLYGHVEGRVLRPSEIYMGMNTAIHLSQMVDTFAKSGLSADEIAEGLFEYIGKAYDEISKTPNDV